MVIDCISTVNYKQFDYLKILHYTTNKETNKTLSQSDTEDPTTCHHDNTK